MGGAVVVLVVVVDGGALVGGEVVDAEVGAVAEVLEVDEPDPTSDAASSPEQAATAMTARHAADHVSDRRSLLPPIRSS